MNLIFLQLLLFSAVIVSCQESRVVETEYGEVRGFWSDQFSVWRFLGIPYARAPIGNLRYKAPVPPEPWNDVFNATDNTIMCVQSTEDIVSTETEDCLILNVYVPQFLSPNRTLPVLLFVHGGGFLRGNSNNYNPHWTTRHEVILVTFNHRLGPFGYLCLGTKKAPGNAGLKDQLEVLRWIQRNIANFGGDPASVTIYGESASGATVEMLVLSDASNGLFQRAIIESGSALANWAFNYNRLGMAKATALQQQFSYSDDLDRLGDFYENMETSDVKKSMEAFGTRHVLCVENHIPEEEIVLESDTQVTLESGNYKHIPILIAYAELDGMLSAVNFFEVLDDLNSNFEEYLPINLIFPSATEKRQVAQRIKTFYFGDDVLTSDSLKDYIDYFTDTHYFSSMVRSIKYHAQHSDVPVYVMEFSYRGGFNQPNPFPQFNSASHADIVAHVMDLGHYNNETLEQDQIVRDRMTEIWTNFVKYGHPTPEGSSLPVRWLPFTLDEQYYLSVDSEMELRQFPWRERAQLWMDIYDQYYYPPPVFQNRATALSAAFSVIFASLVIFY